MDYLTLKNDRRRRRRARALTFLITTALLLAFAYYAGLLGDLPGIYESIFGTEGVEPPVASA